MSLQIDQFGNLPAMGLGTWKTSPGESYKVVRQAIRTGYRHIDCASTYGNEEEIGMAVRDSIKEGIIRREDIWITGKLPNTAHAPGDVKPTVEKSLENLGLDYLDVYLMHWPVATRKGVWIPRKAEHLVPLEELPLEQTWSSMEKLLEQGIVRHLGISNFSIKKLKLLLEHSHSDPEYNQIELHPYLQQPEMLDFCKRNDIRLIAYSPLGSADRPKPLKRKDEPVLLEDPTIQKIAAKQGVPASQVLLAWALHRGTAVIPKSSNPERMESNFKAAQVRLDKEDLEEIRLLDRHYRYVDGSFWVLPNGPYSLSGLWDE